MSVNDLIKGKFYTDQKGRFRKIIDFHDDMDGKRMVEYESGASTTRHEWIVIKKTVCAKQTFASWAKIQCMY